MLLTLLGRYLGLELLCQNPNRHTEQVYVQLYRDGKAVSNKKTWWWHFALLPALCACFGFSSCLSTLAPLVFPILAIPMGVQC